MEVAEEGEHPSTRNARWWASGLAWTLGTLTLFVVLDWAFWHLEVRTFVNGIIVGVFVGFVPWPRSRSR